MKWFNIRIVELPELPKMIQDDLSTKNPFVFQGELVKIVMIEDGWRIAIQKVEN